MACATSIGSCLGTPARYSPALGSGCRPQSCVTISLGQNKALVVGGTGGAVAVPPPQITTTAVAVAATALTPSGAKRRRTRAPPLVPCKGCCGDGAAAAAAGGAVSSSVYPIGACSASTLFSLSSAAMVPVYGLMAFFPRLRLTRDLLLNNYALYIGLSLLYAATLAAAWQAGLGAALAGVVESVHSAAVAGGGIAAVDLSPLSRMFSSPLVTLLSWLHLLALDAFMAREIALDGILTNIPTTHSVLLCFFFGPTGLISHALTKLLRGKGGI